MQVAPCFIQNESFEIPATYELRLLPRFYNFPKRENDILPRNAAVCRVPAFPGRDLGRRNHRIIMMSLVTELERLADALARDAESASPLSLPSVAERIAKNQGVKPDEVAILGLSLRWRHLYFLVPAALKNVGHIPLNSTSALAARTARESRPE